MIEIEVSTSMANEFITKDNMKALEAKIARKINPPKGKLNLNKKREMDEINIRSPLPEKYTLNSIGANENPPPSGKK